MLEDTFMARYGINQQGVDSLNQLASDLRGVNNEIDNCGKELKNNIVSIGENLGIYEEQILEIINSVNTTQEKGRESIEHLAAKLRKMSIEVEELVNIGLG